MKWALLAIAAVVVIYIWKQSTKVTAGTGEDIIHGSAGADAHATGALLSTPPFNPADYAPPPSTGGPPPPPLQGMPPKAALL